MATETAQDSGVLSKVDTYFKISARGSTFGQEIRGGLTTFFTMAYIIVLNAFILVGAATVAADVHGTALIGGAADPGQAIALVSAATALVAGVLTILMGTIARFPLALAAGLGLNAFVGYGLVVGAGLTWPQAMGFVVIEGVVILILVLTKFRQKMLFAVPMALKKAIAVGIGLFIAFIGLVNSGIVTAGAGTITTFGVEGSITTWPMVVFIVGLITAIILLARKVKGALLISIIAASIVAFIIERIAPQDSWHLLPPRVDGGVVAAPDFSLLGQVSIFGGFGQIAVLTAVVLIFSLLVVDFFDTIGTMTAVGEEAGLNDEDGIPEGSQQILIVDSVGAIVGGVASTSSNTAYIESASGVGDGARTGFASVVTGVAFLLATFLTPLYALIPSEAAAPVLVVVGFLMVAFVADIDWKNPAIAIPAFLTFVVMPFGFSIAAGIGVGFIAFVILHAATGKIKDIKPLMWVAAAAFLLYFSLEPLRDVFGI
ncbi:MAG: permease [Actinobacteria bacterium HGW-Actinobacteria-4]|nr:MAG: permease [Actinobacteria bacterium HGW-Actinobacteria-4]